MNTYKYNLLLLLFCLNLLVNCQAGAWVVYDLMDAKGHAIQDWMRERVLEITGVRHSIPVYFRVTHLGKQLHVPHHYDYEVIGAQLVAVRGSEYLYGMQTPQNGGKIVIQERLRHMWNKGNKMPKRRLRKIGEKKNGKPKYEWANVGTKEAKSSHNAWPLISVGDPELLCINLAGKTVPPEEKETIGVFCEPNDDDDDKNGRPGKDDERMPREDNDLLEIRVMHPRAFPIDLEWDDNVIHIYKTQNKQFRGGYSSRLGANSGRQHYQGYDNEMIYAEGINPGTTLLTLTGPGGFQDKLRVTARNVCKVEAVDAQVFGPKMYDNGAAGLFHHDLRTGVTPDYCVDGALADGTSLCVIRVWPATIDYTGWTVELSNIGGNSPGQAHILGSVQKSNVNNLPILPAGDRQINGPTSCGTTSSDLKDGLAFYRPPNNFLIGGKTVDVASFDIVIKNNGTEVCRKPFYLARPPVMVIHGIFSSEDIWKTPVWQSPKGYKISVTTVDYAGDSSQGAPDVYHILAKAIDDRLAAYRRGYASSDGMTRRYAATRADVIGHSQGGQAAKFYIAGMRSGQVRRDPGSAWPFFDNTRDPNSPIGQWPYLRDKNFGAGSIRRLITLGSPFKGSPWASATAPWVKPGSKIYKNIFITTAGFQPFASTFTLQRMFWKNVSDYNDGPRPVTCLADNSEDSNVLTTMARGSYPDGTKCVRWWPVVGIAGLPFDDPWGMRSGGMFQVCYNMLKLVPGVPGASDLHAIDKLNPSACDWIVPDYSQCNVDRGAMLRGGIYRNTTHFPVPLPGNETEYSSPAVAKDVFDILCSEANNINSFPLQ